MKTMTNKKKKENINELCLFSDIDMLGGQVIRKRNNDDIELFTDAVVEALRIIEKLDKPSINRIAEECYYNSLDSGTFVKRVIYLHSLPSYFFNIIQYEALSCCVQQIAIPIYHWNTFVPEECYERGVQIYKQQKHGDNSGNSF